MKIYLAASFGRQQEMRLVASQLQDLGHQVTSRWIHLDPKIEFTDEKMAADPEAAGVFAGRDFTDVALADTVISFTDGRLARGGRHVEFGIGLALHKRMILVGPIEQIFHTLSWVERYPDWSATYCALYDERKQQA